jgi:hypothetical protein
MAEFEGKVPLNDNPKAPGAKDHMTIAYFSQPSQEPYPTLRPGHFNNHNTATL